MDLTGCYLSDSFAAQFGSTARAEVQYALTALGWLRGPGLQGIPAWDAVGRNAVICGGLGGRFVILVGNDTALRSRFPCRVSALGSAAVTLG